MFLHLSVSHSVHRGDVCPSAWWDTHTPLCRHPPGQTSPWTDTRQADTSLGGHPQADTPSRWLLLQTVHILLECILVL